MDWFKELFINEAKCALNKGSTISHEQIENAVDNYLNENPVESATAIVENGVLKVM